MRGDENIVEFPKWVIWGHRIRVRTPYVQSGTRDCSFLKCLDQGNLIHSLPPPDVYEVSARFHGLELRHTKEVSGLASKRQAIDYEVRLSQQAVELVRRKETLWQSSFKITDTLPLIAPGTTLVGVPS